MVFTTLKTGYRLNCDTLYTEKRQHKEVYIRDSTDPDSEDSEDELPPLKSYLDKARQHNADTISITNARHTAREITGKMQTGQSFHKHRNGEVVELHCGFLVHVGLPSLSSWEITHVHFNTVDRQSKFIGHSREVKIKYYVQYVFRSKINCVQNHAYSENIRLFLRDEIHT